MGSILPTYNVSFLTGFNLVIAKGDNLNVSTPTRNSKLTLFKRQERKKELDYCYFCIPNKIREKSDKCFERPAIAEDQFPTFTMG